MNGLWGSARGRYGARMAMKATRPSHPMASQPNGPNLRGALCSTVVSSSNGGATRMNVSTPAGTAVSVPAGSAAGSSVVLTDGSGMADPGVEYAVEDVDGEVHRDIHQGEDGDIAL